MPASGRRIFASHRGRVTKVAEVPLKYAYDWCTDYRSDDGKLSRSRPRFEVIRAGSNRVARVRISATDSATPAVAVELVRLLPPDAWHVDQIDEEDLNSVDYKLTRLGPKRTRITLTFNERWMTPKHPTRREWLQGANNFWDKLVVALEADFQKGLPAR